LISFGQEKVPFRKSFSTHCNKRDAFEKFIVGAELKVKSSLLIQNSLEARSQTTKIWYMALEGKVFVSSYYLSKKHDNGKTCWSLQRFLRVTFQDNFPVSSLLTHQESRCLYTVSLIMF